MLTPYFIESTQSDPYWNIALEKYLLESCHENGIIFYLWQNEPSVIIGRNQDAGLECPIDLLKKDGIHLVRRYSGGGAVYQDRGNLNYTFICHQRNVDEKIQNKIIIEALKQLGIESAYSGRNDLLVQGYKFSGTAYYQIGSGFLRHGTLMIDVQKEKLEKYLTPDFRKLSSKGISSVRSRVVNLKEIIPDITIAQVKQQLMNSYRKYYGSYQMFDIRSFDQIAKYRDSLMDPNWILGKQNHFPYTLHHRFSWGGVTVQYDQENHIKVYTDALNPELRDILENCLEEPCEVPESMREMAEEVVTWLQSDRGGGCL